MTQFDLRFQDLLRHSDWHVEPCHVWVGSSGEWASGESHQRVIHRADPALYVIPRLFRSIVSPKLRSFATWAERRQLVKFAREVVRLDGLSAAWKVNETVDDGCAKQGDVTHKKSLTTLPLGDVSNDLTYISGERQTRLRITYIPRRGKDGTFVVYADGIDYVITRDAMEKFRVHL